MKIDAVRETSVNGTSVTVRKAAYCDMHTPADSDAVCYVYFDCLLNIHGKFDYWLLFHNYINRNDQLYLFKNKDLPEVCGKTN